MRAQNSTKTVDNASQSVKLLVFRFVGKGGAAVRLSMNTRYAVIHASFWGAYGSLWAFIALVLEYNGFASAQVGVVTSCATLLSVFLSPAVSSFLDARPGLENRHGAMALLTLAAALCLLVWLVPLPRPFVLGACFALIGAFLSSTPPFQNAMAMDANRCGIPVVYGFCRGVGSVSYAAAVLLLGFVLERHAPTLLLPVFAALTACGLIAMAGFRLPERPDEAADRPAERRSIAAVLRSHPRFALTLLGCMFFFLTHTISNTYMNALVGKAGGTASAVGTSLAISAVLELPAMTLVSRLQKRFSPGFFLRFAAGAEVVKFLIFYLARSMPLIYLGQCMQFFQFAVYAPATVYYVAAALPERDQLKGQSLIYVAGSGLGGALGNLLGGRLLQPPQHTLFRRDADAVFLAQILRRQGFQKNQPAGAVGDGVEKLHRHPVMVHQHPEGALAHLAEGHMGQGAAFLRLDVRRLGNFLQICRLIRNQGHKYPVVSGKIPVIHRLKAGGGIVNGSLLHRILQLCQKAILAFVDPVIVLSAKHLHGKQSLCLPEGLPQGELVLGVAFKIGGKASALNGAPGAFRHLRQLSPFRQGL